MRLKGKTIGVTTEDFGGPANRWIDREIRVKKWNERLFRLIELGDGYVFFDGGTGTLVELFVVWEMTNKGWIKKPILLLGNLFKSLVENIREYPQVVNNPNLSLIYTPDAVLDFLKERLK